MSKKVRMYTTYYGYHSLLEKGKFYHVSISCATPKNIQVDFQLNEAKPEWNTVQRHKEKWIDDAQYYIEYLQKLQKNKAILAKRLVDIYRRANGKKVIFYCYETPEKFCHRHIFAKIMTSWFNNLEIKEYHI